MNGLSVFLVMTVALAGSACAQAPADAARGFAYDVVSVKPNKSGSSHTGVHTSDETYQATNLSLKGLIRDAFDLQSEDQVIGLPPWTNSLNFDIEAKVDAETLAQLKTLSRVESGRARTEMLKPILTERFQLKVHPESREMPIYELTPAKGGAKLKAAESKPGQGSSTKSNNQQLTATNIPMSDLCGYLSQRLNRQVVDKTGLTAQYDFVLQWTPDEVAGEGSAAGVTSQFPTLFTALQEQLGLKLESTKGPVEVVVVDRVAMPSEN